MIKFKDGDLRIIDDYGRDINFIPEHSIKFPLFLEAYDYDGVCISAVDNIHNLDELCSKVVEIYGDVAHTSNDFLFEDNIGIKYDLSINSYGHVLEVEIIDNVPYKLRKYHSFIDWLRSIATCVCDGRSRHDRT